MVVGLGVTGVRVGVGVGVLVGICVWVGDRVCEIFLVEVGAAGFISVDRLWQPVTV